MPKQEKDTKTITLLKPHRHAGRDYPKGATLELTEAKAQWLVGVGVAAKDATAATPAPNPQPTKEA